jgi:hypothetical protein
MTADAIATKLDRNRETMDMADARKAQCGLELIVECGFLNSVAHRYVNVSDAANSSVCVAFGRAHALS